MKSTTRRTQDAECSVKLSNRRRPKPETNHEDHLSALIVAALLLTPASAASNFPAPTQNVTAKGEQTAVLAGGCFWGVEAVFERLNGVKDVVSGFAGGSKASANYDVVSTGTTGHAEAVKITYDPTKITYGQLLQVFFAVAHDPTQLNRQGPDEGPQYRSSIFYGTPDEKTVAEAYIAQLNDAKIFKRRIVTTVVEARRVLRGGGESPELHAAKSRSYPYVVYNDLPKLEHLTQGISGAPDAQIADRSGAMRPAFDGLFRDLGLAARRLLSTPLFLIFAVGSISIGIATTTAAYSILYAVLWKPLGINQPDDVVVVGVEVSHRGAFLNWRSAVSIADFEFLDGRQQSTRGSRRRSPSSPRRSCTPSSSEVASFEMVTGRFFRTDARAGSSRPDDPARGRCEAGAGVRAERQDLADTIRRRSRRRRQGGEDRGPAVRDHRRGAGVVRGPHHASRSGRGMVADEYVGHALPRSYTSARARRSATRTTRSRRTTGLAVER